MRRARFVIGVVTIVVIAAAGCARPKGTTAASATEEKTMPATARVAGAIPAVGRVVSMDHLRSFGILYRDHMDTTGRPPAKLEDMASLQRDDPRLYKLIKDGDIVVVWGTNPDHGTGPDLLAYPKSVPEKGGPILRRNATAIEKVTAEQFAELNKAPGGR